MSTGLKSRKAARRTGSMCLWLIKDAIRLFYPVEFSSADYISTFAEKMYPIEENLYKMLFSRSEDIICLVPL